MQSEVVDRDGQTRLAMSLLKQRYFDPQLGMERTRIKWEHEPQVVDWFIKAYEREICEALGADPTARAFCNLWVVLDAASGKGYLAGDFSGIRTGLSRAIQEALKSKVPDVAALVRSQVAEEMAKRRDEKVSELRSRKAKDLLPNILEDAGRGLQHNVAVVLDHLSPEQRSDLKAALYTQLSESPVIYIQANREPEDARLWV